MDERQAEAERWLMNNGRGYYVPIGGATCPRVRAVMELMAERDCARVEGKAEGLRAAENAVLECGDGSCCAQRHAAAIRALMPALAERPGAGTDWQPIETAPTSGRRVMLWAKEWSGPASGQFDGTGWGPLYPERYRYQPTHWMPLPAPPTEASAQPGTGLKGE